MWNSENVSGSSSEEVIVCNCSPYYIQVKKIIPMSESFQKFVKSPLKCEATKLCVAYGTFVFCFQRPFQIKLNIWYIYFLATLVNMFTDIQLFASMFSWISRKIHCCLRDTTCVNLTCWVFFMSIRIQNRFTKQNTLFSIHK